MLRIRARKAEKIGRHLQDVKTFVGTTHQLDILQTVYIDEKGISANNIDGAVTRMWDEGVSVHGQGHVCINFRKFVRLFNGRYKNCEGLKGYPVEVTITEDHRVLIKSGRFNAEMLCTMDSDDFPMVRVVDTPEDIEVTE